MNPRLQIVLAIAMAVNLNAGAAGAESRDPLDVDVHGHMTLEADPGLSLREVVARTQATGNGRCRPELTLGASGKRLRSLVR